MSALGGKRTLVFDPYRIAEAHRVEHGALLILNIDAVMEHHPPLVLRRLTERDAD